MKVKVLFFASAREVVGEASIFLDFSDTMTTTVDLMQHLIAKYPRLGNSRATISLAVNRTYIKGSDVISLKEGDEVALLPPISGG